MDQRVDLAALIRMLESVVTDGAVANRKWNQFEQIEFLLRHLKSGQADPELIEALSAFNAEIAAQGKLRQRSTDSDQQARTGLTARAMRLADSLFADLSSSQKDRLSWHMAVHDGSPRPLEGRQS
ncbi:MAG: hypothetical protein H6R17_2134 [Proteobacteria bacterium]|nr:hypothetical protein [Pseudomonadota bacterium]